MQVSLSNRGSLIILRAMRYLGPSFSSSAITQSVMYGIPVKSRKTLLMKNNKDNKKKLSYILHKGNPLETVQCPFCF